MTGSLKHISGKGIGGADPTKPTIAIERDFVVKINDHLAFPFFKPEVPRNKSIVLVGFVVAILPIVKFRLM
jgi:hypothetical protein